MIENDGVNAVKVLAILEMRRKDKNKFVELFGDEKLISLVKDFLPFIYEPLHEIYKHADMGIIIDKFFKLWKTSLSIAEKSHTVIKLNINKKIVILLFSDKTK